MCAAVQAGGGMGGRGGPTASDRIQDHAVQQGLQNSQQVGAAARYKM